MSIIYFRKSPNEAWATIPAIKGADGHTPIKGVDYFTEEEIEEIKQEISAGDIDLTGYATEEYVNDAIDAINILEVIDLAGYATKYYVDDAIGAIEIPEAVDLTGYAKTEDIPDVSKYQTDEQVAAAINEALGVIENGTY